MPINAPSRGLGLQQTWQDVTGSRASGTTYTNTTSRPIEVAVTTNLYTNNRETLTATVNGLIIQISDSWSSAGGRANLSFVVPRGGTYSVTAMIRIEIWAELR